MPDLAVERMRQLVRQYQTTDPWILAQHTGVWVGVEAFDAPIDHLSALTFGDTVILNKRLSRRERMRVLAHELYHALFDHPAYVRLLAQLTGDQRRQQVEVRANAAGDALVVWNAEDRYARRQ